MFTQYFSKNKSLLFRNGELKSPNFDLTVNEFLRTLEELESMDVIPIVFSPLPVNGVDLGRCLARASCMGLNLDECSFRIDEISKDVLRVYRFLDEIKDKYRVVRLDNFICDNSLCDTHFDSTFIYNDSSHLSQEGSAELGKLNDFYRIIVDGYSN